MKAYAVIPAIMALVLFSGMAMVRADFTYQETPDATEVIGAWDQCGGSVIDGDWDTEACSAFGVTDTVNMNYTIPVWATSLSLWQTKGFDVGVGPVTSNISLSGCDLGAGTLMLRVQSYSGVDGNPEPNTRWNGWSCWDGGDWIQLRYSEGPNPNNAYVYDEAMYWSDETNMTGDAYVSSGSGNFGDSDELIVDNDGGDIRTYLYQTNNIPANKTVVDAQLCLYVETVGPAHVRLFEVYDTFNESEIDFASQPCGTGGTPNPTYCNTSGTTLLLSTQGYHCWNVTESAQRAYADSRDFSYALFSINYYTMFRSREYGPSTQPYLSMTIEDFVPPTTTTTVGPTAQVLSDIGYGLGSLFTNISGPLVGFVIVLAIGAMVGVIISGIGKGIGRKF